MTDRCKNITLATTSLRPVTIKVFLGATKIIHDPKQIHCDWLHSFLRHALHFAHPEVLLHTLREYQYVGEFVTTPKRMHPLLLIIFVGYNCS